MNTYILTTHCVPGIWDMAMNKSAQVPALRSHGLTEETRHEKHTNQRFQTATRAMKKIKHGAVKRVMREGAPTVTG